MPAIAHLGIGLAAKKFAPKVNVGILILAAEFIEIIFFILYFLGIEIMPTANNAPFTPYSHSLVMGIVWSVLTGFTAWVICRSRKISLIISIVTFSHIFLDIIASPKSAFYPQDLAVPILFDYSKSIGLGLWSSNTIAAIGELGTVLLGICIYIQTRKEIQK
jgi:membrane-bound metal-dependent hydrolase YbcI (DUF457 family)